MRVTTSLLVCCAFTALADHTYADNWTMYLRDTAHTSFNANESQVDKTNVMSFVPSWTYTHWDWLIASAVSIKDGTVFFGDWQGYFHAISSRDGAELWSQYVGLSAPGASPDCSPALGVSSQPAVVGDVVYVGGGDSAVYALDRNSGNVLWRTALADPASGSYLWSSITYSNNSIYLGIASLGDCPLVRGAVVRISLDTPDQPLIRYLVPEDQVGGGVWSTPAIDESTHTLFVTTGTGDQDASMGLFGGTMLSLDATTLEIQNYFYLPTNSTIMDIEWGSSPTLFTASDGTPMIAATGKDGNLYALTRSDLSLKWVTEVAMSCICPECGCGSLSTPSFDGNMLYVGAGEDPEGDDYGTLYAVVPDTGEIVWKRVLPGTVIAPTTVANGLVYAASTTGVAAFDSQTGETVWEDGSATVSYAQPVISDGTLYTTYLAGYVVGWRVQQPAMGNKNAKTKPIPHGQPLRFNELKHVLF